MIMLKLLLRLPELGGAKLQIIMRESYDFDKK